MALYTEQRKKQQKLITVLVIVFVITLGVLYFGFFGQKPKGAAPGIATSAVKNILDSINEIDFDGTVLNDEKFLKLKPYEVLDRSKIEAGKENPFE